MAEVVFVYPVIRGDFVYKSVESLYKHTDVKKFYVIVVDQSIDGLDRAWCDKYIHLYIRMENQGFAKAANEGLIHGLRWQVPYLAVVNDDTEFIYDGWWEDLLTEFDTDPKIAAICPESPRVPLWGYGRPHEEYIDIVPYKEEYSREDIEYLKAGNYDKLLETYPPEPENLPNKLPDGKPDWEGKIYTPAAFPITKRGVIDGIAMWLPVFKREALIELGLFDERFRWGGGEDYDMNARAYSCAWPVDRETCDEKYHRRMVSTMKSWVWHWWGKSKDVKQALDPKLFDKKQPWNNLGELWTPHCDPWGHYDDSGIRKPLRRDKESRIEPI